EHQLPGLDRAATHVRPDELELEGLKDIRVLALLAQELGSFVHKQDGLVQLGSGPQNIAENMQAQRMVNSVKEKRSQDLRRQEDVGSVREDRGALMKEAANMILGKWMRLAFFIAYYSGSGRGELSKAASK
ncbi:unnamed protein product, partial [Amoebophrya sp. A25]